MPRRLLLIALLVAAGCGGDENPSAQTTAQPAPPPDQTATERPEATGSSPTPKTTPEAVAPAKRALEQDGYEVRDSAVAGIPGAEGALELPLKGGGELTVITFATKRAAEQHAEQYRELADKYPDNLKIAFRDTTLYLGMADLPDKISDSGFSDAVEAAASS